MECGILDSHTPYLQAFANFWVLKMSDLQTIIFSSHGFLVKMGDFTIRLIPQLSKWANLF